MDYYPPQELAIVTRVRGLVKPVLDVFEPQSSVPESFWGALTINETGQWLIHNLDVPARFEAGVYAGFQDVLAGKRISYEGFTQARLQNLGVTYLRALSSSHGLTQVMGYNAVALKHQIAELDDPATHYHIAAELMAEFTEQFGLDPRKDFASMAQCWNGGHPGAHTVPPEYAENLMLRKAIWEALDLSSAEAAA
jgi:hypothetical protein